MKREMTCIICPMGCRLTAEIQGESIRVTGNTCRRGEAYAVQEVTCPMRTVTSLVAVEGGELPLCPVKTAAQVPKARIGDVLAALKKVRVQAPVRVGDVLIPDVAGTGVDIVATANR